MVVGTIRLDDAIDAGAGASRCCGLNGIVDVGAYRAAGYNGLRVGMFPAIEPERRRGADRAASTGSSTACDTDRLAAHLPTASRGRRIHARWLSGSSWSSATRRSRRRELLGTGRTHQPRHGRHCGGGCARTSSTRTCGDAASQCAHLDVPLDYAQAPRREITLAMSLLRHTSRRTTRA